MATAEATTTSRAQPASSLNLLHLPDDLRRHILARVPLADHPSVALVCKEFCGVINDPRFLNIRRDQGWAERGPVSVRITQPGDLTICMAHSGETARISGSFGLTSGSTTDGGSRLFVSVRNVIRGSASTASRQTSGPRLHDS